MKEIGASSYDVWEIVTLQDSMSHTDGIYTFINLQFVYIV
jgi:hypothetical protein